MFFDVGEVGLFEPVMLLIDPHLEVKVHRGLASIRVFVNNGTEDVCPFFEYGWIEIVPSLGPAVTMRHNIVYPWRAGRRRETECSVLCVLRYARPNDLFAVDVHDEAFFILREDLVGDKWVGFVEFKGAKEVHIRRARFGICGRMI